MKKKELTISIAIALVLAVIMIAINGNKKSEVLVDKSGDGSGEKNTNVSNASDKSQNQVVVSSDLENTQVVVYVTGAVKNPQVITMNKGDRLVDAVEKCGGMTKDADVNAVNLAILLKDESHYIIPKIGEQVETVATNSNTTSSNDSKLININTADKTKLMELPAVGEKTAEKIIEYREDNGNFSTKEDLKNVIGIGDKKYQQLEEYITVN